MAGQDRAHVLDLEVALDHGFGQVAEGRRGDGGDAQDQALPPRAVQQQGQQQAPATTQASAEPAKPSQVFFGLIAGAIGCRPRRMPAR